jgi:hypothetical protein
MKSRKRGDGKQRSGPTQAVYDGVRGHGRRSDLWHRGARLGQRSRALPAGEVSALCCYLPRPSGGTFELAVLQRPFRALDKEPLRRNGQGASLFREALRDRLGSVAE